MRNIPQTIHVEPKDYMFSNVSLQIVGAKDLHIDGNGANLIFYYGFGVNIVNSNNLYIYWFYFGFESTKFRTRNRIKY